MIIGTTSNSRRGMTTIAVLVCLLIITLISGALLKVGLAQRDMSRDRERRLQAEWLAESGVDRALARLTLDHNYTGETWPITARELGLPEGTPTTGSTGQADRSGAIVTIAIEPIAGKANRRGIRVQADYPPDPPRRSRHTKQMLIDLEPSKVGVAP
jgi:type II secretory pathway pseudopilin PulG